MKRCAQRPTSSRGEQQSWSPGSWGRGSTSTPAACPCPPLPTTLAQERSLAGPQRMDQRPGHLGALPGGGAAPEPTPWGALNPNRADGPPRGRELRAAAGAGGADRGWGGVMVCSSVNGLRALRVCVFGPTLGLEELLTSAQGTAVCGDSASVRLPALGPLGRAVLGAAGGHRCGQPPELPWWLALRALSSSRCPGALDRPRLPAPAAHPPCLAQPPCFPDEFQSP